ncbi:helix-turn-helix domain-containing protein [Flavobacterium sp. JP2137]|uniref:helix-turn-helix domain-containing protein n=1 Tax=Flavobacterium sp. JP2137 TaxID=3414510 RepID=UPI003D30029A
MSQFKVVNFKGLKLFYLQEIIKIAILFFVVQFVLVYLDSNLYISGVYCPLIYLYKRNLNHRFEMENDHVLIYSQIFFYLVLVCVSALGYHLVLLWMSLVYLISYAVAINTELRKNVEVNYFSNSKHVSSLFMYFMILGSCVTAFQLLEVYFGTIFGFSSHFIILGALLMKILFSVISLFTLSRAETMIEDEEVMEITSDLGREILSFFETSEAYLKPNFSINNLATSLGVRKDAVSEVINREIKMSFYNLVAKYRIDYARKILLTHDHFTIESIVEQCGFHSRTTFNKYFLKYAGLKPSEFRKQHLSKIEKLN